MKILITGGTGLIGTRLTQLLQEKGHEISYLSRSKRKDDQVTYYQWNPTEGYIEEGAIENADYVIHLAGANVAEKRWTKARKEVIVNSRTQTTQLLAQKLAETNHEVKGFIAATAVGIYGFTGERIAFEDSKPGSDFLAHVCQQWEAEVDRIADTGLRTVKIRVGVVLSEEAGALYEIAKPIRMYAGAPLGSGKQYIPWIHIDDICRIFMHAIEAETLQGAFNGVAPNPVTNAELTRITAHVLEKPLFLPNVPKIALEMMFGEMAEIVLNGSKVSCQKIQDAGFQFKFSEPEKAVEDLLKEAE
ncbi:MAG: TIGR01777 family oxidoreductase [Flammeovirgaceae bacterium]